jgi:hypothetical protein
MNVGVVFVHVPPLLFPSLFSPGRHRQFLSLFGLYVSLSLAPCLSRSLCMHAYMHVCMYVYVKVCVCVCVLPCLVTGFGPAKQKDRVIILAVL